MGSFHCGADCMVLKQSGGGGVPLAASVIVKASKNGLFRSWGLPYKK